MPPQRPIVSLTTANTVEMFHTPVVLNFHEAGSNATETGKVRVAFVTVSDVA